MHSIFEIDLDIARSHKLLNLDYFVDVKAALYPVPSLCPKSLKQFFINVSYHILVASLTLMALF